jgi:hypothetical protein
MTLELFNETASISRRYSREFWEKALGLARSYGWKPIGTRLPARHNLCVPHLEWNGSYLTNDGQVVLAEDARSLASALERALDDIPDANVEMDWNPRRWREDDLPEWLSPEEREVIEAGLEEYSHDRLETHPFEFFAGDEKQHLVRFIRFCKLGSFTIL